MGSRAQLNPLSSSYCQHCPVLGRGWGQPGSPRGGLTCPHWGFAARRDGGRDASQAKGELGACSHSRVQAAQGLSQKRWWELPTPLQVFNLPKSSWEAGGAEKQPGRSSPSMCAGSPDCGAFPAPTSVGAWDQHGVAAWGQNHIGVIPFSGWFHPTTRGRSPLGPPTPAHRVPVLALLGMML